MQSTAEVLWLGRDEPLVFLDSLKEAHLFFLEGMKNGQSPLLFIPKVLKYYIYLKQNLLHVYYNVYTVFSFEK